MLFSCKTPNSTSDRIDVYCKVDKVPCADWDGFTTSDDVYFSLPYLKALELSLESGIQFRYVLVYDKDNNPIAKFYFQLIVVGTAQINPDAVVRKIGNVLPEWFIKSLEAKISICGNAFCSGENGMRFSEKLTLNEKHELLDEVLAQLKNLEKELNLKKISITLLKEYFPESFKEMENLNSHGFHEGMFDANMILYMDPNWSSFEDYLTCMKAKYRTKANRALDLSKDLEVRTLSVEDVEDCQSKLEDLYMSMVKNAEFSFAHLSGKAFVELKKALGDQLYFKTYSIENKLVGFAMATYFNKVLDGNFIGLDYTYNKQYAIYQRILYDFVEAGIEHEVQEIRIGRTAEEIKSGIGAEPVPMKLYARHRNKLSNKILKLLVQNLKPSEFHQLKPFKAQYYK